MRVLIPSMIRYVSYISLLFFCIDKVKDYLFRCPKPSLTHYAHKTVEYITGDGLQKFCDVELLDEIHLQNPKLSMGKYIFVNPELLMAHFDLVVTALRSNKQKFVLLLHNSDAQIDYTVAALLLKRCPFLQKIFATNFKIETSRICILPKGVQNDKMAEINSVKMRFSFKQKIVCCGKCKLEQLANYCYLLCDETDDTHEFWESLAVRTIPICSKNSVYAKFADRFPIFLVEDCRQLPDEMVLKQFLKSVDWNVCDERLKVDYWLHQLKSA